ncbi:MAG: phosphoglucomutase, partial [Firmicutes bacterium HGW-Firmicutes-13]
MSEIKFGTDGWRAIIAEQFTFDNVRLVSQAIADYIKAANMEKAGIVIGYDNRFLSEEFAAAAAEVMAGNWIKVYLTPYAVPTPVVAYTVTMKETAGAVMLTASHNPPYYHGIKFIPHYAGPAMPEITNKIMENVKRLQENGDIKIEKAEEAEKTGLIQYVQPQNNYLYHLQKLLDTEAIKKSGLKVVVDPMHGAGIGYLEKFLISLGLEVVTINANRDAFFGGLLPDPSEDNLASLKFKIREHEADLGFALDGDADRLGVIDNRGNYLSPNQILFMLLRHLIKTRKWQGLVARTVATTHMLDLIAQEHKVVVEETPVGFKYIGDLMLRKGAFLGGEESGGLSIRGHVPEKDGILGCLLFLEMIAVEGKSPMDIMEDIFKTYGRLVSRRLD